MTLDTLVKELQLTCLTPEIDWQHRKVTSGYVSDLMSDVLANGPAGGLLVTGQVHLNVLAVAVHAELSAICFANGRRPDKTVCDKAREEKVVLLYTEEAAFNVVGRLYQLGLKGMPSC
ncbi:MAG: hypothetical protein HJJLKODD_00387 [Phycisphaerae bacterium]|nr:hypothetical protein [Phycisphaerae bacterium]